MSARAALLALLLAAGLARAEGEGVDAPLGGWAREGVPVLLRSGAPIDVRVGAWPAHLDGVTAVVAPELPCAVTSGASDVARLEAVPAGVRLVGVVGADPRAVGRAMGDDARAVPIDLSGLEEEHWPALDLFDRIVVGGGARLSEGSRAALAAWVRGGGSLLAVGFDATLTAGTGIGTFQRADSLESLLDDASPLRGFPLPRAGTACPTIYDLVPPVAATDPAASRARWIVTGAALALLLQLALSRLVRLERRTLLAGLALVAALGGILGLLRPRVEYRPLARGTVEISYRARGWQRVLTHEVAIGVGPGATLEVPAVAEPCFYRAPGDPWWRDARRTIAVPPGTMRIFRTDRVERTDTPVGESGAALRERLRHDRTLRALVRAYVPDAWRVVALDGPRPPRPGPGEPSRLLRLEVAPQD